MRGADRDSRRQRRNREHDRDRGSLLNRGRDRASHRNNDIHPEPDELGRHFAKAIATSLRPAILNRDGVALGPAKLAQPLHQSRGPLALLDDYPGMSCGVWQHRPESVTAQGLMLFSPPLSVTKSIALLVGADPFFFSRR